jgi:DNA repair exonuclease SbcCD ATPase subunit
VISAVAVRDFKRIKDIAIKPDADRSIILIGGRNAQGKSSLLDALTVAIGGKKMQPADPVRHGAKDAEIMVELDGGELTVRRRIQPDGESVLEVRDRLGAGKAPQTVLDTLIAGRVLDPLQFLSLPAKEQRAQLMRVIGEADRIEVLDGKRERAFKRRTEVGRDLTKAEGELARLPEVEVGTPIDVAELTAESKRIDEDRRKLADTQRVRQEREADCRVLREGIATTKRRIADLERQLAEAREQIDQAAEDLREAEQVEAAATKKCDDLFDRVDAQRPRLAEIEANLSRADQHNRAVYAAEAQTKRRAEAAATVEALKAERDNITKAIAVIDERKAEILAEAKLPIEGLGVDGEGVTLGGVPFAQASGAERFRVALALAIAASPGLDDVWIRDGAVLDDEALEQIATQALAAGKRPWIEVVGTRHEGAVVISEGMLAADKPEAA